MQGYLVFRVPTEAPGPTSGEATNPHVGPIFQRPTRLSYLFTRQSTAGPQEAGARDPGASTINVKTSMSGPREVLELEI
jgi:hypothetical protein